MSAESSPAPLPYCIPTVSFDIRLGGQLGYIDFDYGAYTEHLATAGLSSEQIEQTSVVFTPLGLNHRGRYIPDMNEINVSVPGNGSEERVNKALSHETQHRIDHTRGNLNSVAASRLNRIVHPLIYTGLAASCGTLVLSITGRVVDSTEIIDTSKIFATCCIPLLIASFALYRFGLKPERLAHKAEKRALPVVSIQNS